MIFYTQVHDNAGKSGKDDFGILLNTQGFQDGIKATVWFTIRLTASIIETLFPLKFRLRCNS